MAARMANFCPCQKSVLLERIYSKTILRLTRSLSENVTVTSSENKGKIIIPKRKKRDELSVLKALASTVEKDKDAPHYKYIDDPFLIPTSAIEKKTYTLAKISGRRAAQYVMQNHSQFFQNRPMEDFSYTPEAYKVREVPQLPADTLEGLEERILLKKPMLAYQSYQEIRDKGEEIPTNVVNDLLEILCFYNSKNPEKTIDAEEIDLIREVQGNVKAERQSWDTKGPAETLFKEMQNRDYRSYSSILRGRAKYKAGIGVLRLHEEMKEKRFQLSLQDYNALLTVSYGVPEISQPSDYITEILKEMHSGGVDPTVDTFNCVLNGICHSGHGTHTRLDSLKFSMNVINEMRHCGIEPTLASWYYILKIYYDRVNDKSGTSRILYEVMEYLEGKEFSMHHPDDNHFFSFAMRCCFKNLNDIQLAYKVDALLNRGKNIHLLGDSEDCKIYYFNFMKLICTFEDVDTVMKYYDRFTPHDYTVTFGIMQDIVRCVDMNEAYHWLPRLWSDYVLFGYQRRGDLLVTLLNPMGKMKHEAGLQKHFVEITDNLLQLYESDKVQRFRQGFQFSARLISDCISICCHGEEFEKAKVFFTVYQEERRDMSGFVRFNSLQALGMMCVNNNDVKTAMDICTVMYDLAYKIDNLVQKMKTDLELNEEQLNYLQDLN